MEYVGRRTVSSGKEKKEGGRGRREYGTTRRNLKRNHLRVRDP